MADQSWSAHHQESRLSVNRLSDECVFTNSCHDSMPNVPAVPAVGAGIEDDEDE